MIGLITKHDTCYNTISYTYCHTTIGSISHILLASLNSILLNASIGNTGFCLTRAPPCLLTVARLYSDGHNPVTCGLVNTNPLPLPSSRWPARVPNTSTQVPSPFTPSATTTLLEVRTSAVCSVPESPVKSPWEFPLPEMSKSLKDFHVRHSMLMSMVPAALWFGGSEGLMGTLLLWSLACQAEIT